MRKLECPPAFPQTSCLWGRARDPELHLVETRLSLITNTHTHCYEVCTYTKDNRFDLNGVPYREPSKK